MSFAARYGPWALIAGADSINSQFLDAWEKREGCWRIARRMAVYDHEETRNVTPMGQEIRSTRGADDPSYGFLKGRKWGETQ